MILGTGLDLVSVPRFRRFQDRFAERGLARLFTAGELRYCLGLARPMPSLAVRFAAKEAFFKAAGTGCGAGGRWTDVEVQHRPSGQPLLRLHGPAARLAGHRGVKRIHLTLSHTAELAAAFVLLEGDATAPGAPTGEP